MLTNSQTPFHFPSLNRRDFLYGLTSSLGALAVTDILAKDQVNGFTLKKPMHPPKAKNVISFYGRWTKPG